ncbi:MAG TPA: TonB-dependent receptor, partial [Steroidobacter sp.]
MLRATYFACRAIVCVAGVLLACHSAIAGIDLSRVIRFDIPAQGLGAALLEFSRQAHVQIIVESRLAESVSTTSLNGEYSRSNALEMLLHGSGLTFRAVGNAAIAIQAADAGEESRVRNSLSGEDAERALAADGRDVKGGLRSNVRPNALGPGSMPDEDERLGEVIVVGTRRLDRSAADTPVPIDQIAMATMLHRAGQFEVGQIIQFAAPSFNSNRQVGADGADHIDSAALRGLGPDQTLVLVNGKRQHSVALVNVYGSRARGNTGTDLNTIPSLAIERIDVLRDGAAAQYGSDAIAGVVNIGLKRTRQLELVAAMGEYTRGDGENTQLAVNYGFDLGARGFMNLTGEYLDRGPSNRNRDPCRPHREIGDASVEN